MRLGRLRHYRGLESVGRGDPNEGISSIGRGTDVEILLDRVGEELRTLSGGLISFSMVRNPRTRITCAVHDRVFFEMEGPSYACTNWRF